MIRSGTVSASRGPGKQIVVDHGLDFEQRGFEAIDVSHSAKSSAPWFPRQKGGRRVVAATPHLGWGVLF
jgi:hypothetical protein